MQAVRKSKRNLHNNKPMLDSAQEVKRKWDPEPSKGKKISTTKTLARDDFISVAKVVNISVLEGSLEEKHQF